MVGGIIYGVGFLLLGYIDGLWMFYMMFLVISVGSSGCNPIVTYIAAAQWFRRKRGRSMGIISLGSAFSGIMVYLLVVLISQFGWRTTVQVLGIASWAVILPLALVFRHRPEQYGLLPDGDVAGTNSPVYSRRTEVDFRFKEAVSTRNFWYLGAVFTLWTLVHGAVISQLISALKLDGNVSLTVAGAAAAGGTAIQRDRSAGDGIAVRLRRQKGCSCGQPGNPSDGVGAVSQSCDTFACYSRVIFLWSGVGWGDTGAVGAAGRPLRCPELRHDTRRSQAVVHRRRRSRSDHGRGNSRRAGLLPAVLLHMRRGTGGNGGICDVAETASGAPFNMPPLLIETRDS